MKITAKQIRDLIDRIVPSGDFSIDNDHYWVIPQEEVYNVYNQPENLTIGQLSEDWDELQDVLNHKREPILFHDLAHLSHLLQAIAQKDKE